MNKNQLIKTLSSLGLNDNEAFVYIAGLTLGPSTILKLSREAGVKRTTVYSVVESLKQKGLMFIEQKGWKQYYVSENPKKLKNIIEKKKNKLKESLPGLLSLYNMHGHDSLIKYYEGLESVKSAYEDMLKDVKAHEDYCILSDANKWFDLDRKYFMNFTKKRAKLNINIKILLQNNKEAKKYIERQHEFNSQVKLLPKEVDLKTNLVFIPKRAIIHQLVPPIIAVSVENPNIIQMYKEMFEVMWKSIKK
ncbi:MAG: TrmB family transcriptional regulator [Parcubacteria group bacterium]